MTDYNLSMSDLMLVSGFAAAAAEDDTEVIHSILHTNGLDINKEHTLAFRCHRNLRNQVVEGYRFEGQERTDVEWIKSGYASLEARIEATDDPNLRHTLRTMSVTRNQEKVFD